MPAHDSDPIASVLILTYNQEHLVADTLKSVLAQQTSFPFEIVIGDDASQDGTAALCEALGKNFPSLRVLRHPVNLGHIRNFHTTLAACRGRYVALLGGDDIWTDPTKLERQVTFLRNHPDHLISHTHNDLLQHATGEVTARRLSSKPPAGDSFDRLAQRGNFITASTAVFDREALTAEEIDTLRGMPTEDYPLWLCLSRKGKIHHIAEPCVRYRVIAGSVGRPAALEKRIQGINESRRVAVHFCELTPGKSRLITRINNRNDIDILRLLLQENRRNDARAFAKTLPFGRLLASPRLLKYRLKAL